MSADSASSSSARRLLDLGGAQLLGRVDAGGDRHALDRLLLDDLHRQLGRAGLHVLGGDEVEILVLGVEVEILVLGVRDGGAGRRDGRAATRAHRGELRLLDLHPGPAGARGKHGFDELLVQGIGHVAGSSERSGSSVQFEGQPAAATGARARRLDLVAAPVERPALLVEETLFEGQAFDGLAVAVAFGLGHRVAVEGAAVLPLGVVELEDQALDLVGHRVVVELARVGPGPGDEGLAEGPALLVEAVEDRGQRVRGPHAVLVAGPGEHDRAVQLAGDLRREAIGAEAVEDRVVRLRDEEHEAQQRLLGRRDGPQDVVDGQRVRRVRHGLGGEPVEAVAPLGLARGPVHRLEQRALLDPGHLVDQAEVGVAHDRVGQAAEDGQHLVHEPRLAARRAQVVRAGVDVDEVVDDRLRRADLLAPAVGLVAQHLVGVLALGQADDADVVELDPRVVAAELADELLERGRAEGAGLLAGRVDVVGERDPLRVPGDQRDLLRRERRAQRRDDVLVPGLVRHQRVGVALDDDGLAALADGRLGAVDEVQRAALVEQRGRRAS